MNKPSKGPKALHSSAKSGYAHDIMPERANVGMTAAPVPPASGAGKQYGRPSPVEQIEKLIQQNKNKNKPPAQARTVAEALAQMSKKTAAPEDESDDFDPFEAGDKNSAANNPPPGPVTPEEYPDVNIPPAPPPPPVYPRAPSKSDAYLSQRRRISFELSDATLFFSAIDVVRSPFGVTVLLPAGDSMTCIPKPGSPVVLTDGNDRIECYFPGGYFDIPELGMLGLPFVRADKED